ncbi:hypothetical protein I4U23_002364 [Adineta vaga]|nr:hypothetical protein I4U23_002364 [Adineta vaga]
MSFSFATTAIDSNGTHYSSSNNMHHQQYMSPLTGSSSSSTGGSPTTAVQVQANSNMPLLTSIANVKDSRWLTLEVCREYQRGKCTRSEQECKFAHPPTHVEVNSGKVIACFDSLKGKCNRTNPPCKYLHPPQHLRDILLQNGRNNLILRSIAMNIAANQAIYPQTPTHMSYPNGAILQSPLPQPTSMASYPHLSPAGPGQSTLVFNSAGQAFSIPLHAAHLQQLSQATTATAMYSPDGAQYYQPVTQISAQPTGPKMTRTDRLESYLELDTLYQHQNHPEEDGTYNNNYVQSYQPYSGQIQTIYTQPPSVEVKDSSIITSTNIPNSDGSSSSTTASTDNTPPGTQFITASQYLQQQQQQQQQTNLSAQHQKRPAVADPKTGIPMAAYPMTAFSYPSPTPLPIQFQQPYLTAVPMASQNQIKIAGYTSHLPRL